MSPPSPKYANYVLQELFLTTFYKDHLQWIATPGPVQLDPGGLSVHRKFGKVSILCGCQT